MATLGTALGSSAPGVGEMANNRERQTVLGAFAANTWVTAIAFWGGRSGSASATAGPVLRDVDSSDRPTAVVAAPAPRVISTYMAGNDRTTGAPQRFAVTSLPIAASRRMAAGIRTAGSGANVGSLAYGQDNSGALMTYDDAAATLSNPMDRDRVLAQGRISVWVEGTTNRKPNAPTVVSPADGSVTVDPTPAITIRFTDPDTGLGDYFAKYRIEVWSGISRLADSGVVTTSSAERSAGQVTWTVPAGDALAAGGYQLRVTVYDHFGLTASAQTTVTVNSGGAITGVNTTGSSEDLGTKSGGVVVMADGTVTTYATWTHADGADTATTSWRVVRADTHATVVRATATISNVVPAGTDFFLGWSSGWPALPAGATRYQMEVWAVDAFGSESAHAFSPAFEVNAGPALSDVGPVDETSVSSRPVLTATVSDANDGPGSHTVTFFVGPLGGPLVGYAGTHVGNGVWQLATTATHLPALGTYSWYVRATDPWGASATWATLDLHYVSPPAITNVAPADGATVTSGTPTVTATVDRTMTQYRIIIYTPDPYRWYYDSGWVAASGTAISHQVPGATLPNATDYVLDIYARTTDGLQGTSFTAFRVEYPAPWYLDGVALAPAPSSVFDLGEWPQEPNVALGWVPPDTATVSDEDWIAYRIARVGGGMDREWTVPDRQAAAFTDTNPPPHTVLRYYVSYRQYINDGLDTIESLPVLVTTSVEVRHTTITSESADEPAATLRYWEDRGLRRTPGVAYVPIMGLPDPVAFQSISREHTLEGEFPLLDDQSGNDRYTALMLRDTLGALAEPVLDANGDAQPRPLWWRDPTGRCFRVQIDDLREGDGHRRDRATLRLSGTRVSSGPAQLVSVNDDQALDATGQYVLDPSLPLRITDAAYRGDPWERQYQFFTDAAMTQLLDTTGWTARMWIVAEEGDSVPLASSDAGDIVLTTGIGGTAPDLSCLRAEMSEAATLALPAGLAGWYDIELTGTNGITRTYVSGPFRASGEAVP